MTMEPVLPQAVAPKRSATEVIKENSRFLRGTMVEELVQDVGHFCEANKQLLKFHGSYQQDNRDARKERGKEGVGRYYMFMVRCKIPGGKVTGAQYLTLDELADRHGNGTLRITSRQGIQFHGVLKTDLKDTIATINSCLLTTLGACGDVERNVIAPPAPKKTHPVYLELQRVADLIAAHFAPRSRAYHEIWLNGQPVGNGQWIVGSEERSEVRGQGSGNGDQEIPPTAHCPLPTAHCPLPTFPGPLPTDPEPLYGKVYLPRKFKTGLALPEDNTVDIYGQDLGLLAIHDNQRVLGYNVLAGGSMGMSPGNPKTFPMLAKPICYVPAEKVLETAEGMIKLFRDHGNRADRKQARLKYLVHSWGVDKFRAILSEYVTWPLELPRPVEVSGYPLHLGWNAQGDGQYWYGVHVETGRIKDEGPYQLRTALRTIIQRYQANVRLTTVQDILLCDLPADAKPDIERILLDHGVTLPDKLTPLQTHSLACPATPTCGLAITESERILPKLIDELEVVLRRLGLQEEKISVRMTGCPNGCVRPYQSDIGIVGRSGDKYTIYVGGHTLGMRMNFVLQDLVPFDRVLPLLTSLLENFQQHRQQGECFGDYCQRLGKDSLLAGAGELESEKQPADEPHSDQCE